MCSPHKVIFFHHHLSPPLPFSKSSHPPFHLIITILLSASMRFLCVCVFNSFAFFTYILLPIFMAILVISIFFKNHPFNLISQSILIAMSSASEIASIARILTFYRKVFNKLQYDFLTLSFGTLSGPR